MSLKAVGARGSDEVSTVEDGRGDGTTPLSACNLARKLSL